MQYTLAEVLPIRASMGKRLQELEEERMQNSTVTTPKGEIVVFPDRTVDQITEEINELRADIRELDFAILEANMNNRVEWDGEEITIMQAISIVKDMRSELKEIRRLARTQKEVVERWGDSAVTRATFDPEAYRKKAERLERQANKLSSMIDRANFDVMIDIDLSKYAD
jgi:hypothetical protein